MRQTAPRLVSLLVSALAPVFAMAQPCEPWSDEFAGTEIGSTIRAIAIFDDGSGPAVYAAKSTEVVRWYGAAWVRAGEAPPSSVHALAVFDDGDGPALFAGGEFEEVDGKPAMRMARWDGKHWKAVGGGVEGGTKPAVNALVVYDDGTGPALYAGGRFQAAGRQYAMNVARWDGHYWTRLGLGTDDRIHALTVWDSPKGKVLVAGGQFHEAGFSPALNLAAWNGKSWSHVDVGVVGIVKALETFDAGGGSRLYVGGQLVSAGALPLSGVAAWDGVSWSDLDGGVNGESNVTTLEEFDDGAGPALYVGGDFAGAAGLVSPMVARWDGTQWSNPGVENCGGNCGVVYALTGTAIDGPVLLAGGSFDGLTLGRAVDIARWTGGSWLPFGRGADGDVTALAPGSAGGLYAAGAFLSINGVPARRVARHDGSTWSALGDGIDGNPFETELRALALFDDGTGEALYAAGRFESAGGQPIPNIARWDGQTWSPVGGGIDGLVHALAVFDDGAGAALYAAGFFESAGGLPMRHVARWDGHEWSEVGGGLGGVQDKYDGGWCLSVVDIGDGPALYLGGGFSEAGGNEISSIARWDGASWAPLGPGLTRTVGTAGVRALKRFDGAAGPSLCAAGYFNRAGDLVLANTATWDGAEWSAPGGGFDSAVLALEVFDDGSGPALYATGPFAKLTDGTPAKGLARWDGLAWSPVGAGLDGKNYSGALAVQTHGAASSLVIGGDFLAAAGHPSRRLARYQACPCPADCDQSGALDLFDFLCFLNASNAADPAADCDASGALDLFDFLCFVNAFNGGCS